MGTFGHNNPNDHSYVMDMLYLLANIWIYNVGSFISDIAKRVVYGVICMLYLAVYHITFVTTTLVKSMQSSADEILGFDTISVLTNWSLKLLSLLKTSHQRVEKYFEKYKSPIFQQLKCIRVFILLWHSRYNPAFIFIYLEITMLSLQIGQPAIVIV